MATSLLLLAGAALWLAPAAPARAGLGDLLDIVRGRLDPVLLADDVLTEPGKEVTLTAGLRTGLRLEGMPGKRIQFHLDERRLGEAVADKDGNVSVRWTAPEKPGDYRIRVRVKPADQPDKPVEDTELLVSARKADTPLVIVDLDKTVVASGFARVLLGGAEPMAGASAVMTRLAANHAVVYLTHRPDFLGPGSKKWLKENGFPGGPLLTSSVGGLLSGSGTYKTGRLADIKQIFKEVRIGIGDKFSDAKAYADNGLRSILILHVDWSEDDPEDYEKVLRELAALPESVQVVTDWSQVAAVLFDGASHRKQEMEKRLRDVARRLRRDGH